MEGSQHRLPSQSELQAPTLQALARLGGSATTAEIESAVATDLGLTAEQRERLRDEKRGKRTELAYRMAWARTRLREAGLVERDGPRRWKLTKEGHAKASR